MDREQFIQSIHPECWAAFWDGYKQFVYNRPCNPNRPSYTEAQIQSFKDGYEYGRKEREEIRALKKPPKGKYIPKRKRRKHGKKQ